MDQSKVTHSNKPPRFAVPRWCRPRVWVADRYTVYICIKNLTCKNTFRQCVPILFKKKVVEAAPFCKLVTKFFILHSGCFELSSGTIFIGLQLVSHHKTFQYEPITFLEHICITVNLKNRNLKRFYCLNSITECRKPNVRQEMLRCNWFMITRHFNFEEIAFLQRTWITVAQLIQFWSAFCAFAAVFRYCTCQPNESHIMLYTCGWTCAASPLTYLFIWRLHCMTFPWLFYTHDFCVVTRRQPQTRGPLDLHINPTLQSLHGIRRPHVDEGRWTSQRTHNNDLPNNVNLYQWRSKLMKNV